MLSQEAWKDKTVGKLRILRELGRGSMSSYWNLRISHTLIQIILFWKKYGLYLFIYSSLYEHSIWNNIIRYCIWLVRNPNQFTLKTQYITIMYYWYWSPLWIIIASLLFVLMRFWELSLTLRVTKSQDVVIPMPGQFVHTQGLTPDTSSSSPITLSMS